LKVCENQFYCIADHAIAIKGSIIVNVGWHFYSRVCGKFIEEVYSALQMYRLQYLQMWLKVGIAVGP
jgi:hypothetical protein